MSLRLSRPLALCAALVTSGAVHAAEPDELKRMTYYPDGSYAEAGNGDLLSSGRVTAFVESGLEAARLRGSSHTVMSGGLRGSVAANVGAGIRLQGDFAHAASLNLPQTVHVFGGTLHASYVDDDRFGVGVFAGGEAISVEDVAVDYGEVGIEAAGFAPMVSVLGRAGMTTQSTSAYFAEAEARFYVHDNLRLDGSVKRLFSIAQEGHLSVTRAKARLNYRPHEAPVTYFGGVGYDEVRGGLSGFGEGSAGGHTIFAGLRYSAGSSSLKAEERGGALWSPAGLFSR